MRFVCPDGMGGIGGEEGEAMEDGWMDREGEGAYAYIV